MSEMLALSGNAKSQFLCVHVWTAGYADWEYVHETSVDPKCANRYFPHYLDTLEPAKLCVHYVCWNWPSEWHCVLFYMSVQVSARLHRPMFCILKKNIHFSGSFRNYICFIAECLVRRSILTGSAVIPRLSAYLDEGVLFLQWCLIVCFVVCLVTAHSL